MEIKSLTKEKFEEYVDVQKSGYYNMWDPRAREMTSLTEEEWLTIIKNYSKLKEKWDNTINQYQ